MRKVMLFRKIPYGRASLKLVFLIPKRKIRLRCIEEIKQDMERCAYGPAAVVVIRQDGSSGQSIVQMCGGRQTGSRVSADDPAG